VPENNPNLLDMVSRLSPTTLAAIIADLLPKTAPNEYEEGTNPHLDAIIEPYFSELSGNVGISRALVLIEREINS